MRCPKSTRCSATADLSECSRCILLMFLQPRVHGTACLPNVDLAALTGFLYTTGVLSPTLSLTGRRKVDTFLRGRPADLMLCRDSLYIFLPWRWRRYFYPKRRFTQRHIPEYGILHSHRRENLKSYVCNIVHHLMATNIRDRLRK
jgi:hypothetical protein